MLDLGFDNPNAFKRHFMPDSIERDLTINMFEGIPESVKAYARTARDSGWRFYVVDQSKGRCYGGEKVITIPKWVILWHITHPNDINKTKKTWYISHELAHAFEGCRDNHGDRFMSWLKQICPENCIHWELGYKPRNATRNGIGLKL